MHPFVELQPADSELYVQQEAAATQEVSFKLKTIMEKKNTNKNTGTITLFRTFF
jgi:hypothetical protein